MESLHWLWKKKCPPIPVPIVMAVNRRLGYGGCYYHPQSTRLVIEETSIDLVNGLILFVDTPTEVANTLAHEWRHHEQWCRGIKSNHTGWTQARTHAEYREKIITFFRSSTTELDALLYSRRKAPSDLTEMWIEWLYSEETK